jgi:hypothetical protein
VSSVGIPTELLEVYQQ